MEAFLDTSITKNKVVMITGASAGVGRATAHLFAKTGARIGLLARGLERLEETKKEVEALGGKALVLSADVSNYDELELATAKLEKEFGVIDIWINNAMVSVFSPIKEMTPEEFQRVTEVTYLGYVYGSLIALKRMLPRNHGVIIQVGSGLAYRSIPLQSAYCAAKHAVLGFSESLRCELLHDKSQVQVCTVELAAINTPQFDWTKSRLPHKAQPVPPIYQPEIAARAILKTTEQPRKKVYVGFSTVKAVLAEKLVSNFADLYLAMKGYEAQQTKEPAPAHQRDNLWEPTQSIYKTHGPFDGRARRRSFQQWYTWHKKEIYFLLAVVLTALS
jgi:short-subunit dehydrogenase